MNRTAARTNLPLVFIAIGVAAGAVLLAGCNGGNNGEIIIAPTSTPSPTATPTPTPTPTATPTPTPTATPTPIPMPATNTSVIAVDCKSQRAYVPLLDLNPDDLHGQVAVLDLSVDPDKGNPLIKVIDVGFIALPRAAAVDPESGTVMVLLDNVSNTGVLLLINETDDSLSSFPFPTGSRPAETSGIVFDPSHKTALVSMSDSLDDCTKGVGDCTGQAVFDLNKHTFGPLILTLSDVDSFGLDSAAELSLASSDPITPLLYGVNVSGGLACVFDDRNINHLDADPDDLAVDPTTGIWVAGSFESPTVSVVNLKGSSFAGDKPFTCTLNEGGTPPNSVNHDTGTGASGMPGVAINPVTHEALMTADTNKQIALLSLPSAPVTQLTAAMVTGVHGTVPADPLGVPFAAATFPYATAVDSCHNLGYVLEDVRAFLVQIDLATFAANPPAISAALPPGTCAGVATSFSCDNGSGIKFFPLPGASSSSSATAPNLPAQFINRAFSKHKNAE